ncbi:LacI family DNA-binding transcriptional regulator [Phyllobacterium zundukense]|uniref:HTH lacI-type domain-containing protein n=1 Tax=Phyllobacterium zundukense TaxID=1867719 RepID=A0A2N9VTR8_9HYPH|nr:LacI family DNA-binding transcriptional regulator [Phyllobacterium zundukense]PIO42886.1 hypothetical protein B5P45_20805 [Phyllobacterium zundukense]
MGGDENWMKLQDLANELGLSLTTVSRALNDYPEVSNRTRARVKGAAARMGYRPNVTARGLAIGEIGIIAIVVPKEPTSYLDPDITEFLAGLAEVFASVGQDILIIQTAQDDRLQACKNIIESRRADAIVICYPAPVDDSVRFLAGANFPFVVYGKSRTPVAHTWVDVDHREAAFLSAVFLFERGHEKIAAIEGPAHFAFVEERMAGITCAFEQHGTQIDASHMIKDMFCDSAGYQHTLRLLRQTSPPTGFVYGSLLSAIGGKRAIRELDLNDRIAVVTHDNAVPYLNPRSIFPRITITSFSIYKAARRVAQHVIRMMADNAVVETELWAPRLISVGQTRTNPSARQLPR